MKYIVKASIRTKPPVLNICIDLHFICFYFQYPHLSPIPVSTIIIFTSMQLL